MPRKEVRKMFVVRIPKDRVKDVADMLRYDDCYSFRELEDAYEFELVKFTRERWASFGCAPKPVQVRLLAKDEREKLHEAVGFTRGIRFAQELLGGYLIQA